MTNSNKEVGQVGLYKFNKEISVTVPVDSIAKKLHDTMDKTNPHAALITNVIIGTAVSEGTIGQIYNALNGWKDEVNITVGKTYDIKASDLNNCYNASTEWRTLPLVSCMVKEVNEYTSKTDNVTVEFNYTKESGEVTKTTCNVRHKELLEHFEQA